MSLWPKRVELMNYFPQYRAIALTRLLCHHFPVFSLVMFMLVYALSSGKDVSLAMFYLVFLASMPFQALLLLGKKSQEKLPPALASWYREGVNKLKEQYQKSIQMRAEELTREEKSRQTERHQAITEQLLASMNKPVFMDLARLLNLTYQQVKY